VTITSIENEKIKNYAKLNNKKYRDETGLFIIEGEHLINEAYKNNFIEKLILLENTNFKLDVDTIYVTKEVMKKLSTLDTPSNMMAICRMKSNNEIIGNKVLLLDGIQDPGNLGTIIRSAVAFNVSTIVLGTNTVDLYNSKVLRSTQGMNFYINIINADLVEVIDKLHREKFVVYGTDVNKGTDISDINLENEDNIAIVVGNEGQGISREVYQLCDDYLHISMNNQVESLNVSVATSILLYELDRRK
jgi:TrmH family RNA methyltransferase